MARSKYGANTRREDPGSLTDVARGSGALGGRSVATVDRWPCELAAAWPVRPSLRKRLTGATAGRG
jgi:hypothetical protein